MSNQKHSGRFPWKEDKKPIHQYVLERDGILNKKLYFCKGQGFYYPSETFCTQNATKYDLDGALERSRELRREYGLHYKVVRISD